MTSSTKNPTGATRAKPPKRKPPSVKRGAKRGGNRWVFPTVLAGIVVLGIVAVALVATGDDDAKAPGGKEAVTEVASEVSISGKSLPRYTGSGNDPAVGTAAPGIESVDFQDEPASAGGATGRPYALVFLAHWCPHCQAEVPRLVAVGQGGKIEGVEVTAVATGTSPDQPNYPPSEWLAREDWPYGVVLDDEQGTAGNAFGLSAYPFLVFVDADGNVAGRTSGEISEEDLTAIFSALAKGDPLPIPGAGAGTQR